MTALVIVRPEPGASATAARAKLLGLETIVCPLFVAQPLSWTSPDPDQFDALVFTSANAVRLSGIQLRRYLEKPVFAVGERTADAARDYGFKDVTAGLSSGRALIEILVGRGCNSLLHLAGADALTLCGSGATVTVLPVYEARAIDPMPDFLLMLEKPAVVMIHSPRAGRAIATLCDKRDHLQIIAISRAAAFEMGSGWCDVRYPEYPRDDAMLELANQMCKCSPQG